MKGVNAELNELANTSQAEVPHHDRPENPSGRLPEGTATIWRWIDAIFLLALAVLILLVVRRHEPWADEAQSWLLARDLGWFRLVFHELRFEGHPGAWHTILWIAIHVLHAPYSALGYIGGGFGIAGLAVLVWYAPFPRLLRYLMATSFFFAYQYAVIDRSYNLIPLLSFAAAALLLRGNRRLLALAAVLALLVQVSIHGAVIAIGLAALCGWRLFRRWSAMEAREKRRAWAAAVILVLSLLLAFVELYPPHEQTVASAEVATLTTELHLLKTFLGLDGAICDVMPLSFLLLFLTALWCLERRLLPMLLFTVLGLALIFGFLRGVTHHEGLILTALITTLWIAWPGREELARAAPDFRYLHWVLQGAFVLVFALQSYWTWVSMRNDWRYRYTGAYETAELLKSRHADQMGCYGYNYWTIAVQPYFEHNIFPNMGGAENTAFFHNSEAYVKRTSIKGSESAGWRMRPRNPPCFVVSGMGNVRGAAPVILDMEAQGYDLVFAREGREFFKAGFSEYQTYYLFQRRADVPEERY